VSLDSTENGTTLRTTPSESESRRRSLWGLSIPTEIAGRPIDTTLESSPFYARLGAGAALVEVADFRRFASPYFRWMAYFRSRAGAAT
jgi:carotenoid 1,2-hydratase